MTCTPLEMTEDEFDTRYPLVINHLNPNASWGFGDGPVACLRPTARSLPSSAARTPEPSGPSWTATTATSTS